MPATLSFVALLLIIGIATGGLWNAIGDRPWFDVVAYGLPSFEAGRWWTPITGTFLVVRPWVFIPTIIGFFGMAYLEYRRGSQVALLYYAIGQLFAICATALVLTGARLLPWPWAQELAGHVDVGASGGTMACVAAAIGLLVAPWRQRAWVVLFAFAAVSLLFLGTLADLEHALAIALVLAVDRSFRIQKTTVPEQRLLAFTTLIALGVIQLIVMLVPTAGPLGSTELAATSVFDVVFDTVVLVIVALGLRRGRRWGWILALLLAVLNILVGALALLALILFRAEFSDIVGDLDVTVGTGVLWLAFAAFLLATRRAFRTWRRARTLGREPVTVDEVKDVIRADGGGTLSWMTTWEGMHYLQTSRGIVPLQVHHGVGIVLADPLGAEDGRAESVREFIEQAEARALVPCFFSASEATRAAVPPSWRSLTVADDTIVDLPELTFQGKAWAKVRQSFSRADREQVEFRMGRLSEFSWGIRQQIRAISESWVGDKGLPEMRFTLGTLQEAEDPEVRLAIAVSPEGDVDGVLSWLPVYGAGGRVRGWTLDLMRRRDGGFGPVMEFLIGSSAKAFAEEGAEIRTVSGAPLANEPTPADGTVAALLGRMGAMLEPVYGFRSLHTFKKKFNPRYEPIYLLYRDEGDLPRIGTALTRAFLPDATLRQFAAAGVDLVRR